MKKDDKQLKTGNTTLESSVDNIVSLGEEEGPNIEISEQKEFFRIPKISEKLGRSLSYT